MATYYTIDPKDFTDGEWAELYNCSTLMPKSMEIRRHARPFKRQKFQVRNAAQCAFNKIESVNELLCPVDDDPDLNEEWTEDLRRVVEVLSRLTGDVETCPKCAASVVTAFAFQDEGTGEEAGRTFYYCSEECREKH